MNVLRTVAVLVAAAIVIGALALQGNGLVDVPVLAGVLAELRDAVGG